MRSAESVRVLEIGRLGAPRTHASTSAGHCQLLESEERKNSDEVAISGVQATIAFADAFTIVKLGLRCRGQDHREVVGLISRIETEKASALGAKVQAVLNRKAEVEYGDRDVRPADAARIATAVRSIGELVGMEFP